MKLCHRTINKTVVRNLTIEYYFSEITIKLFGGSGQVTWFPVISFYKLQGFGSFILRSKTKHRVTKNLLYCLDVYS